MNKCPDKMYFHFQLDLFPLRETVLFHQDNYLQGTFMGIIFHTILCFSSKDLKVDNEIVMEG